VEAMSFKVIMMMPKNQELNKVSSKDSRIKFQESRFKNNQDQDSRIKKKTQSR